MLQGIWCGMLAGTVLQTAILFWVTYRTNWNKERGGGTSSSDGETWRRVGGDDEDPAIVIEVLRVVFKVVAKASATAPASVVPPLRSEPPEQLSEALWRADSGHAREAL
ncbi:hypothetical protein Taro_049634, partial [Colocasia esculenta]|nr:hypothetical protein [Colocasia esculenta]